MLEPELVSLTANLIAIATGEHRMQPALDRTRDDQAAGVAVRAVDENLVRCHPDEGLPAGGYWPERRDGIVSPLTGSTNTVLCRMIGATRIPPEDRMRHCLTASAFLLAAALASPSAGHAQNFKVEKWNIGGDGGTDYLTAEAGTGRVFVSRGTHAVSYTHL